MLTPLASINCIIIVKYYFSKINVIYYSCDFLNRDITVDLTCFYFTTGSKCTFLLSGYVIDSSFYSRRFWFLDSRDLVEFVAFVNILCREHVHCKHCCWNFCSCLINWNYLKFVWFIFVQG